MYNSILIHNKNNILVSKNSCLNKYSLMKLNFLFITFLLTCIVIANTSYAQIEGNNRGGIVIIHPSVEYLKNPLGIDETIPRFSWKFISKARDKRQTAYQIIVASSLDILTKNTGDVWNTGKKISSKSNLIDFAGIPLKSRMQLYWKVMVWDEDNQPSSWSSVQFFSMGLLDKTDWKAKFISYNTNSLNTHKELFLPPPAQLIKQFYTTKKIVRATIYSTALGIYELTINGNRIGDSYFTPGWTDYDKRLYYQTFDVTPLINSGDNTVAGILATGWYAGYVGYAQIAKLSKVNQFYGDVPALLAQLEIEFSDGTKQVVITDETWKANTGAFQYADMQMGEFYDATKEAQGWDKPKSDISAWKPVEVINTNRKLQAYPGVPVKKLAIIKPVSIKKLVNGNYQIDLGQNFSGWVKLRITANRGDTIKIRHGEMLHKDGRLMTENLRKALSTDYYIAKGNKVETYEPRFTYHGFQYVEISGLKNVLQKDDIEGIVVASATDSTGNFTCSNPLINKLYSNSVWSQRTNYFDVPTDCPQRDERLGWTGDAQIYVRAAANNCDIGAFFTKWCQDLEDAQYSNGIFSNFAPKVYEHGGITYSAGWSEAGIICPYTIYKMYGDTRIIKKHWASMTKFMDWHEKNSAKNYFYPEATLSTFSPRGGYGDWLSLPPKTSPDLLASMYLAYCAKLMNEMAVATDNEADSKKYALIFQKSCENIKKHYMDADGRFICKPTAYGDKNGYIDPGMPIEAHTQTAYANAIFFGLLSKEDEKKASIYLNQLIKDNNNKLSTGFLGVRPLMPALSKTNNSITAYHLLNQKEYPSWLFEIVNNATTIWERWDSYTTSGGFLNENMNSFNHYSFGAVSEWMFANMAGINTIDAGFKKIVIRPELGDESINYASANYTSTYGRISSSWKLDGNKITLDIEIPVNTTALVYIPAKDLKSVLESGIKITDYNANLSGNGYIVVELGSGIYKFSAFFK